MSNPSSNPSPPLSIPSLVSYLRLTLPIRNRQHLKRLFPSCFVGSEAVSLIVSVGYAATRAKAIEVGREMVRKSLLRHVTDGHDFKDDFLYYRFAEDESLAFRRSNFPQRAFDDLPEIKTTCAGFGPAALQQAIAGGERGFPPSGSLLKFSTHTAHNSLVLSYELAATLERAFAGGAPKGERAAVLQRLRGALREEYKVGTAWKRVDERYLSDSRPPPSDSSPPPQSGGSFDDEESLPDPKVVTTFKKQHSRGTFHTIKTVGYIPCGPTQFASSFLDLDTRGAWDSSAGFSHHAGVVVEEICNDDDSELPATPSPTDPPPPSPDDDRNRVLPATYDVEWNIPLVGVPTGMPIAKLLDRSEEIAKLTQQIVESDPDGPCMRCSVALPPRGTPSRTGAEERRVCGCCGIIVCTICCSKLVYEVYTRQVVKICPHCHRESSRVKHPV
ncbi:hypothetical protein TeGR_g2785 [Tetraparma gracilis]|uniref:DEP domain-containing protein n=1 Tax=Tetraparma gracilis TaxID=2962635 RepID=A0ABQ6MG88_9STRA|nr:hypothetical protein TeGR_g2785 [Tetraparma gracilis]